MLRQIARCYYGYPFTQRSEQFGQLQMIPHLTIEFKIKISEQKSRSKRMAG